MFPSNEVLCTFQYLVSFSAKGFSDSPYSQAQFYYSFLWWDNVSFLGVPINLYNTYFSEYLIVTHLPLG